MCAAGQKFQFLGEGGQGLVYSVHCATTGANMVLKRSNKIRDEQYIKDTIDSLSVCMARVASASVAHSAPSSLLLPSLVLPRRVGVWPHAGYVEMWELQDMVVGHRVGRHQKRVSLPSWGYIMPLHVLQGIVHLHARVYTPPLTPRLDSTCLRDCLSAAGPCLPSACAHRGGGGDASAADGGARACRHQD